MVCSDAVCLDAAPLWYALVIAFLADTFASFPEFALSQFVAVAAVCAIVTALLASTARARAAASRSLWALGECVARRHAELDRALADLLPPRHASALRNMLLALPPPPEGPRPAAAAPASRAEAGAGGCGGAGETAAAAAGRCPGPDTVVGAVLCADLVQFTGLAGRLGPERTFELMHRMWCDFDALVEERWRLPSFRLADPRRELPACMIIEIVPSLGVPRASDSPPSTHHPLAVLPAGLPSSLSVVTCLLP